MTQQRICLLPFTVSKQELGCKPRQAYLLTTLWYLSSNYDFLYSQEENQCQEDTAKACQISEGEKKTLKSFGLFLFSSLFVLKPLKLLADGQEIWDVHAKYLA